MARRIAPDPAQVQVLIGTLLGRGRLVANAEGVHLALALDPRHAWLAEWTYQRLAPLVPAPVRSRARVLIRSERHPIYGELASLLCSPGLLRGIVGPEAIRLWALYMRLDECERRRVRECRCALLRPPPPRMLAPAS
ncbi:MAG: hypothetical protein AUH85_05655 [Chloroflexi bacterium 13_1_40CM_4_68_4]|nr:MAG: hypothetical protein AUH85_05655 [Chloroflexi bacterium 13_1_40CM_4_68_4]